MQTYFYKKIIILNFKLNLKFKIIRYTIKLICVSALIRSVVLLQKKEQREKVIIIDMRAIIIV